MKNWKEILISPVTSIRSAIETLDKSALQIVLVTDENSNLLGTITDGDVRRAVLKGISLNSSVQEIMNSAPTVAKESDSKDFIYSLMRRKSLRHIPIVNQSGTVVGLETIDEFNLAATSKENWVVLMAGGLGSRLYPLTENCPKPMLKVGNKPLLETILENFIEHGFRKFYISVNYMADVVKSYFGDGVKWGVEIQYLQEDIRLGTAGALSLLPETPKDPLLVMNADLLTKVNFKQLIEYHQEHSSVATMCVREFDFQVPYGVVKIDRHRILGIDEKPTQRFFVNAGIYVLQPAVIELIPTNTYFDMPSLFEKLISQNKETACFPIREYWLDIGQIADYDRAQKEWVSAA